MNAIGYRIHDCLLALFIVVLLSSCSTTEQRTGDDPVRQRADLEGRPLATAFDRFGGHTDYDHIARASDLGGEFYTPINARFPLRDPASRNVFIREVRWLRGDRYLAVFCTRQHGTWVIFDAVDWRSDIVF